VTENPSTSFSPGILQRMAGVAGVAESDKDFLQSVCAQMMSFGDAAEDPEFYHRIFAGIRQMPTEAREDIMSRIELPDGLHWSDIDKALSDCPDLATQIAGVVKVSRQNEGNQEAGIEAL